MFLIEKFLSIASVSLMSLDPRTKFSQRADYYDRFRPGYPPVLLDFLGSGLGFSRNSIVADVGSGTGILTEFLLKNGNAVYGIEPNREMRKIAEAKLSTFSSFTSVDGSAEATTLERDSVDFVTAAQAFHWFRPKETKAEFRRILRQNGWAVLIWNTRLRSTSFLREYEELVSWVDSGKKRVNHEDVTDAQIAAFLGEYKKVEFSNSHQLDRQGLVGRLMSASYFPLPGSPLHEEAVRRATELFDRHERNGLVTFEYRTEVYAGQLGYVTLDR